MASRKQLHSLTEHGTAKSPGQHMPSRRRTWVAGATPRTAAPPASDLAWLHSGLIPPQNAHQNTENANVLRVIHQDRRHVPVDRL